MYYTILNAMSTFYYLMGSAFILSTAMSFSRSEIWWIRIFDFPRLQIACSLILAVIIFPFIPDPGSFKNYLFLSLIIMSFLYHFNRIYPYTPLAPVESDLADTNRKQNTISILGANILMSNRNTDGFIKLVREYDPDIICVLEPDKFWEKELAVLDHLYEYSVKHPRSDTYGMIVLSKLEMIDPELRFIIEDHVPSVNSKIRMRSGEIIEFYCLHPSPPNPRYAEETTQRDAELVVVGRECVNSIYPCIVAGDLNDVAWSYTTRLFQKISKLLDPRKGRGFYNTFHAGIPLFSFPLDHIFHSISFKLGCFKMLGYIGSDHYPIYVELVLESENKQDYKGPAPDGRDIETAGEKVKRAMES